MTILPIGRKVSRFPGRSRRVARVLVFIPALNEAEKLPETLTKLREVYRSTDSAGFRMEFLVVDDGSTDDTAQIAEEFGAHHVVRHSRNLGLGAATRTALRIARSMGADVAVKLDADLQHDPADIARVMEPVLRGDADIVYGSRFRGKIHYRMPVVRRVGNRFFTWLMRKITGWPITDAQTGLMVYSREYMRDFSMPGNYNPPHQTLIDAYHRNLRYAEVPVDFHARTTGESFVSFRYPFKALPQMIRTLVMVSPLRVFVPIGLATLALGFGLGTVELVLSLAGKLNGVHDATVAILICFGIQSIFFGLLAELVIQRKA